MKDLEDSTPDAPQYPMPQTEAEAGETAPADPKTVGDQLDGGGPASGI